MNEIQQYKKQSAEWMGSETRIIIGALHLFINDEWVEWKPDLKENAYQRELIEDRLVEKGCRILTDQYPPETIVFIYPDGIRGPEDHCIGTRDKSKSIAFMKAFMLYIKTIK